MTAFAMFQKYWLSLVRYSVLKSPSFMLCKNLIETYEHWLLFLFLNRKSNPECLQWYIF